MVLAVNMSDLLIQTPVTLMNRTIIAEIAEGLWCGMPDRKNVIKEWEAVLSRDPLDAPWDLIDDTLTLLKEQRDVQWINVNDKLPEKDGQYLVVYAFFDYKGMGVVRFSHNLHEIDEYVFDTESRPGWYEPDDEVGYFERTTVTHWAKLPEFPKEGR